MNFVTKPDRSQGVQVLVKVAVGIRVGVGVEILDQASHTLPYRRRQMVYDHLKSKTLVSSSFS